MSNEVLTCVVCHERLAIRRGCCSSCYAKHCRDVSAKKTTWIELEQKGKVLPKKSQSWKKYK